MSGWYMKSLKSYSSLSGNAVRDRQMAGRQWPAGRKNGRMNRRQYQKPITFDGINCTYSELSFGKKTPNFRNENTTHLIRRSLCVTYIGHVNKPLHSKLFWGNINIYLHFMSLLHIDMTQVVEILPCVRQGPTCSIHIQYLGFWWPGDAKSRGISNHDIYYVEPDCFGPARGGLINTANGMGKPKLTHVQLGWVMRTHMLLQRIYTEFVDSCAVQFPRELDSTWINKDTNIPTITKQSSTKPYAYFMGCTAFASNRASMILIVDLVPDWCQALLLSNRISVIHGSRIK